MKRATIKQGSFRRLLRNLRKDSEGELTPIQALRAKQDKASFNRREKFRRKELAARDDYFRHIQKVSVEHWAKRNPEKGRPTEGTIAAALEFRAKMKAAQPVPAKRSGLKRSSSLRSKQRRQYRKEGKAYLLAHPYCQITIALLGLDEADVIKHHGAYRKGTDHQDDRSGYCYHVSRADQLHHRNKTNGIRLLNFDYIMTSCPAAHHWTENHLDKARSLGLLCPINCKPDGTMPDGTKQPTTTELLASRHAAK